MTFSGRSLIRHVAVQPVLWVQARQTNTSTLMGSRISLEIRVVIMKIQSVIHVLNIFPPLRPLQSRLVKTHRYCGDVERNTATITFPSTAQNCRVFVGLLFSKVSFPYEYVVLLFFSLNISSYQYVSYFYIVFFFILVF